MCQSSRHSQAKGFTLVELIIVIVLLAIIAITAMPKFVDLSKDAKVASLHSIKGAVDSLVKLVEAKARLEGVANGAISIPGSVNMQVRDFSPIAHWNNNFRYILDLPGAPFPFTDVRIRCEQQVCGVGFQSNWPAEDSLMNTQVANLNNDKRAVFIWQQGYRLADGCYVYFIEKSLGSANDQVLTGTVDKGC